MTQQLTLFDLPEKKRKTKIKSFEYVFWAKNNFTKTNFKGSILANSETEFKRLFKKNHTTDTLKQFNELPNVNKKQ
jgi:hypothetical protein